MNWLCFWRLRKKQDLMKQCWKLSLWAHFIHGMIINFKWQQNKMKMLIPCHHWLYRCSNKLKDRSNKSLYDVCSSEIWSQKFVKLTWSDSLGPLSAKGPTCFKYTVAIRRLNLEKIKYGMSQQSKDTFFPDINAGKNKCNASDGYVRNMVAMDKSLNSSNGKGVI